MLREHSREGYEVKRFGHNGRAIGKKGVSRWHSWKRGRTTTVSAFIT